MVATPKDAAAETGAPGLGLALGSRWACGRLGELSNQSPSPSGPTSPPARAEARATHLQSPGCWRRHAELSLPRTSLCIRTRCSQPHRGLRVPLGFCAADHLPERRPCFLNPEDRAPESAILPWVAATRRPAFSCACREPSPAGREERGRDRAAIGQTRGRGFAVSCGGWSARRRLTSVGKPGGAGPRMGTDPVFYCVIGGTDDLSFFLSSNFQGEV